MTPEKDIQTILNEALGLTGVIHEQRKTSQVRVPYAEKDGKLVHVSSVERGLKCDAVCPVCKTMVVARKGAKIRHHFAHYPGTNCSAETVLHFIAKQLIYKKLISALFLKQILRVHWKCIACSNRHSFSLLDGVKTVTMEKNLDECRPDIALLDSDQKPLALIEIVVTHRPDSRVLDYCNQRQIPLLIFRIDNAEALEALGLYQNLEPTVVLYCPLNRCEKCGAPVFRKRMYLLNSNCWRCGGPMKIALMDINSKIYGPNYFSDNDRAYARERGVVFRQHFNKKRRLTEAALGCPNCGVVTSNRYLGFLKKQTWKIPGNYRGFVCLKCRHHVDEE
ncbi:MAG: hypothetical protein KAU06_01930 [Candidatus Marinimicrobia bacterium]|nr:hypothetical protein [Candidatus Neomarinimicrobiota bacterium]